MCWGLGLGTHPGVCACLSHKRVPGAFLLTSAHLPVTPQQGFCTETCIYACVTEEAHADSETCLALCEECCMHSQEFRRRTSAPFSLKTCGRLAAEPSLQTAQRTHVFATEPLRLEQTPELRVEQCEARRSSSGSVCFF